MNFGLTEKTVLITGASGGIGSEVARLFARHGAYPAIHCFRGRERAEAVQSSLAPDVQSTVVVADLTDEQATQSMFEQVESELGVAQVLIANAGVWPTDDTPISQMSLERWNQTVAANLTSVFLCVRQFLSRCCASGVEDPAIVMIGSTAGFFGEAGHGDYAASKSALMGGLMESLKNEIPKVAPRGRINTICPGWTLTPMAEKFQDNQEAMLKALQTIPLKKFASPLDIAKAVLFFASNEWAGHITGQSLFVSGGMEGRVLHTPGEIDLSTIL